MVGVDSSNHNMIVWDQLFDSSYDSIIIYKESAQSEIYERVATQSAVNKSVFIDIESNPDQNSNRYKISILDTCGYETELSDYHKTIHLTINAGINDTWNLIWDGYEGFDFSTYNIYRGTSKEELVKIAEQPSNIFTFSDLIPPIGTLYYQLEVINPNSCFVDGEKSSDDNYSSTRSNIVSSNPVNIIPDVSSEFVKIWPNPSSGNIYIQSDDHNDEIQLQLWSIDGKLLLEERLKPTIEVIDISHIISGLYIIRLKIDNRIINKRLIIR